MLAELRQLANQRDVPYQSLIKVFLRERIDAEYTKTLPSPFTISDQKSTYTTKKHE